MLADHSPAVCDSCQTPLESVDPARKRQCRFVECLSVSCCEDCDYAHMRRAHPSVRMQAALGVVDEGKPRVAYDYDVDV